ncbi:MAG: aminotransferase class V-fold PLP-dependent enzyme [Gemmataceae bacterium]|nr:aminotransferase class V-fold PLP-dependent enzyme [Gemmataceae bacterium]
MHGSLLYLDTARLGRMSPRAQQAQRDFALMAGRDGGSVRFERLLRAGVEAVPAAVADQYPGLAAWRGVGPLKASLRALAGGRPDLPVLLATRSAALMRLAARLLFHPCRNVLVTDLGWPAYHAILEAERVRTGRRVTTVPLLRRLLDGRLSEDEAVEVVRAAYLREGCDGLFLTAVSNLGVRLPIERVVRSLEAAGAVRFVVIDGAQDFCHAPADLRNDYGDLYLAGSHKWLGAYHPMGLGFYGRPRSRSFIETVLALLVAGGGLDDPLLRFSTQLEDDALDGTTETVGLAPVFACQGAVADALAGPRPPADVLPSRLANSDAAADVAAASGWTPHRPRADFRSGILLLDPERMAVRELSGPAVRAAFDDRGVAVTGYDGGRVRLSMPPTGGAAGELDHLGQTLRAVA